MRSELARWFLLGMWTVAMGAPVWAADADVPTAPEGEADKADAAAAAAEEARIQPFALEPVLGPLTDDRLFREAEVAVQVVDVGSGDEVYAWQPDTALVPASVMKVLTSAAALKTLGPAFHYETVLHRTGEVNGEGVL